MPFSFSSVSSLSSVDDGTHEWHPSTHIWGCTLSKDKPSVTWSFFGRDDECHTLTLKQAVLGVRALPDERNVIEVETKGYHKETICQPIISLTLGKVEMCIMDITFDANKPVKFSLTSGTGPVHICAQHEVDYDDESDEDETFDDGTAKARGENRRHTIAASKQITGVTSTTAKNRTAVAKKLKGNAIQKKKPPAAKSIAKQAGKMTPSKKKSSTKGAAKKAFPAVKKATAVTTKNKAQSDNDAKLTAGAAAAANSRKNSCSAGICQLK